jgi:hypothetical protein
MSDITITKQSAIFLRNVSQSYNDIIAKITPLNKYYKIANFTIKLEFVNDSMVKRLTAALAHAEVASSDHPDLTIKIWDSASTHSKKIFFPREATNLYGLKGEVVNYTTTQIITVLDIHTGVLNILDKQTNTAYYWIDDEKNLPWWINGSPLQLIIHWWMNDRDFQLTHCGVVGYPSGGVLLAGSSGAGKSTTTLACTTQGMKFVSEDYCLLKNTPTLHAYTVYSSSKLEQRTVDFFPELKPYISNINRTEDQKAFLFQHQFAPERIILGCPVKAVLILKIQDATETHLSEASSEEGLKAIAMSTMAQLTHSGKKTFALLKNAVESVPSYFLNLGSDLKQIPRVIEKIL